jgi:hypothetical protein
MVTVSAPIAPSLSGWKEAAIVAGACETLAGAALLCDEYASTPHEGASSNTAHTRTRTVDRTRGVNRADMGWWG